MEEKLFQLGSHTLLRTRNLVKYLQEKSKISVRIVESYGIHEIYNPYFNNKDKVKHHSCVIYRGTCSCGVDYIGEPTRNSDIKWNEHITVKDKN